MKEPKTKDVYNKNAENWVRKKPTCLSDFTGRPPTLDLLKPITNMRILDLGCGEGYCSRILKEQGAGELIGIDISEEMISRAKLEEEQNPLGIDYRVGNATDIKEFESSSFDRILAVFLFNYLNTDEITTVMKEVYRLLKPGARFVFAVPHPMLAFVRKKEPPFFFDAKDKGYFSGVNELFEGKIWRRDGTALDVRSIHKTIENYFNSLKESGFTQAPIVKELGVTETMLELDFDFFSPVKDVPLHLLIAVDKK